MTPGQTTPTNKLPWQRALITLSAVVTAAFVLGMLYWAQTVFIPLALAIFFAFILNPLVLILERRRLGRTPSVLIVVALALLTFAGTGLIVTQQLASLSKTMVEKSDKVKTKIETLKARFATGGGESGLGRMVKDIQEAVMGAPAAEPATDPAADPAAGPAAAPVDPPAALKGLENAIRGGKPAAAVAAPTQVVIAPSRPAWLDRLNLIVGPATEAFGLAAFSFVLVVFILLAKDDLRDRTMRLIGDGQMTTATRAADEASQRISRYLLMQFLVNAVFGVVVTIGLLIAGIQYSLLWGFIGFLMRYVPYIGTWIGLLPPLFFTAVVSDGWAQPITVLVLFGGFELFLNNAVEPRLYGQSVGASEVALLLSAAFWSFLWGPIGLILSGPITTCLLVMGKYSPSLSFFHVILGTEPPLSPGMLFYQRLIAGNEDDATKIVETALKTDPPLKHFDEALLPALVTVREAKEAGELDAETEARVIKTARTALDNNLEEHPPTNAPGRVRLLACAARDELDALTVAVLARTLPPEKWDVRLIPASALASEVADAVTEFDPHMVLIGSLPPGGVAHTRYTSKRLRSKFPKLKILIGRWTDTAEGRSEELLKSGADAVDTTLEAAHNELMGWQSVVLAGLATTPAATPSAALEKRVVAGSVGTPNA